MDDTKLLARINELFDVDIVAGKLFFKVDRRGAKAGSEAGHVRSDGYVTIWIDGKHYYRHRLIFLVVNGCLPVQVDHINQTPGDDRMINLRSANNSNNNMNKPLRKNNVSGEIGVFFERYTQRWRAEVMLNRTCVFKKRFRYKCDAIDAVRKARIEHHGEFNTDINRDVK